LELRPEAKGCPNLILWTPAGALDLPLVSWSPSALPQLICALLLIFPCWVLLCSCAMIHFYYYYCAFILFRTSPSFCLAMRNWDFLAISS
jgi:hypothetical protein